MLLEIRDLNISVHLQEKSVDVVDRVSLSIPRGKVVALVGESGCGKSLTALSILRLLPKPAVRVTGGQVIWHSDPSSTATVKERADEKPKVQSSKFKGDKDLLQLDDREMRAIRGREIATIFQEPMTALNPVFTVGEQIAEVLILHRNMGRKEAWKRAAALLEQVGIAEPHGRVHEYPHQFSGGMRQRVLIAMALACRPQLLIADEPTTALDVTIQAQILDLLREIQARTGMSILLITHDLGVVAELADYVYVMYAGRIVEHAPTNRLFAGPAHPYTQGLFRCTPRLDDSNASLSAIPGVVPDPAHFPTGCRFHPRCGLSLERAANTVRHTQKLATGERVLHRCVETLAGEPSGVPQLRAVAPDHFAACWEV